MSFRRGVALSGFARRHLGRMAAGRRGVMEHLAAPTPSNLPMPTFVQLRVTNLCNLRCKMCGQWGDTGIYRSHSGDVPTDGALERQRIQELIGSKRQLALGDYVRLLDEIAAWNPIVSLFGGEPFLYPDIVPLIAEIKQRRLTCTVITNGGRLEALAKDLVELGIDSIAVSIDGPPDVHNRIRGRSDSFERAAAGIRAVARLRKQSSRKLPMVLAILPVTELNLEAIGPAVEALRRLPLDTINVGLRWFIPQRVGEEYERVMREELGVEATSWKGFAFDSESALGTRGGQLAELVRLLKGLRRRRFLDSSLGRPWTSFVPGVQPERVPEYFSNFSETFGHAMCPVAWYFAQVEPDGEVCFCGDFPDYFIGNVRRQSFREVWTGEKAARFRQKLAREPLPICARCCGNYVYGKWHRPKGDAILSAKDPATKLRSQDVPELVEVEPLGGVETDHAFEVRGDAAHDARGVLVGREPRVGGEGLAPDVEVAAVGVSEEEARKDLASAEARQKRG
jgi:MoaA/NifB/PqqE/SkfB family radical SAM enzyme